MASNLMIGTITFCLIGTIRQLLRFDYRKFEIPQRLIFLGLAINGSSTVSSIHTFKQADKCLAFSVAHTCSEQFIQQRLNPIKYHLFKF